MSIDQDRMMAVLDKAHEGPVYTERDFNIEVIPKALAKSIKKYGLANTSNPDTPVNVDDELADRYYQAGFETAVEIGLMCRDTYRVIKFSSEELQSAIEQAPEEFWLGEGDQQVHYQHRDPEDATPPVWTVPLSIAVSEDVFVPMVEGLARLSVVDAMQGPSLETLWGRPLRSGSPYEHVAGRHSADIMREGVRRAGREGVPLDAVGTSMTEYGVLGGYGIPGGYSPQNDIVLILSIADFWTSYESIFKLTQTYVAGGENISAGSWSMLGGYAGGPEGCAVACVAYSLLLFATFQASRAGVFPFDLQYMGNTGRRAQWAMSIAMQALSRNTKLVVHAVNNQVAGPCTKMLLYESVVGMTNLAASGVTHVVGTRSAGGRLTDYLSPLEHQFAGEVYKAAAGISREQANEIANQFIPKYEEQLREPPDGKRFQECYDVERLEPTAEWQKMYDEVREEVVQAGLPL